VHPLTTRLAWSLAGLAWAGRSLLEFARPDYQEPVTLLDWLAVASFSIAWLLSAIAVILLSGDVGDRTVRIVGRVFAIAAAIAGLANVAEDALGQSWAGMPYVVGFLVAWLTLIPLGVAIWRTGWRRMAILPVTLFASIALFNSGGGLIILVAAAAFAVAPHWFRPGTWSCPG
jgi:hypothetical protein